MTEEMQGYRMGDFGPEPGLMNIVNDRGLFPLGASALVLKRVRMSQVAQARAALAATAAPAADDEDIRTLSVLWNNSGERQRSWDSVMEKSVEEAMKDWPLTGPRTTLWLMRHIQKNGGSPPAYLTRVLRDLKLTENDRSAHELELMMNCFELGAGVDQMQLCNLACFELMSRRVQLILDANSGSGAPTWEGAEHFMGLGRRAKGIAPLLQAHVAGRLKDEAEIDKQRTKAREARKLGRGGGNAGKDEK